MADDVPKHVRHVRSTAFAALGLSYALLLGGPSLWNTISAAFAEAVSPMDVGDWIAVFAAVIAAAGLWHAHRSASASERSAKIASQALEIAHASAIAAEKSADAEVRATALAEANHLRDLAPKWIFHIDEPRARDFAVTLQFTEGPNEISVAVTYIGLAWEEEVDGVSHGHPVVGAQNHNCLHPNEPWSFWIEPSLGENSLLWVELTITTSALDNAFSGSESQDRQWEYKKWVRSEERPPDFSTF